MATISLCMIVKNEENVLSRCLDSIYDLVDEIIIVDTGSTDSTKDIAYKYTNNVYDFEWIDDFSAARNFSFSKCSMEYIYVADADEYLDDANRYQFKLLKDNIFSEIEIVQMMYETISHDTVLNIKKEYRPKLFKRLREFTWINPVHETVRLDPLVFDSDIVVTHAPESNHASRDFSIFEKTILEEGALSMTLQTMYAKELYKNGSKEDFNRALNYFSNIDNEYGVIIKVKCLRLNEDPSFEDFAHKFRHISEVCFELGEFYLSRKDYDSAYRLYEEALNGECYVDIHVIGDITFKKLIECCEILSKQNDSYLVLINKYKQLLDEWQMPEEHL
ncbi:MAG: glycosyltransferase [Lachnospiraceae bacterium]|nr:glycosyltransferase [Lachnospiraceae bacterium]